MLYLIDPRGAVWQSADYTLGKAVARQRVDGRPVDDLPLATARLEIDAADALDLALRHGLAAPRGILLDGSWVSQVLKPATLKAQRSNQDATAAQLEPVERYTEGEPVNRHHRDVVREGAPRALDKRIEQAEKDARDALQAAPRRELLAHWRGLGGTLPETIVADLDDAE